MANTVFFYQACPVCGRSLRIRVALLGRNVCCSHCDGSFVAADPAIPARLAAGPLRRPLEPLPPLADRPTLERVEALLERAALSAGRGAAH
jgi:hypothetical protein